MSFAGYKQQTIATYDALAIDLVEGFEEYFDVVAHAEADHFLSLVEPGGTILDAGCGGGQTSAYFARQGRAAVSVDLSREMLNVCRQRGLSAIARVDLEALPFRHQAFDGIWAHTSLIHIPKQKLSGALIELGRRLKPDGALFIALRQGENEGYLGEPGLERWFSNFEVGEFERHIPAGFGMVRRVCTKIRVTPFLNYHLVKTSP